MSGLYWRGLRNAQRIDVRENVIARGDLPPAFDGYTILQISDLHVDLNARPLARLAGLVETLDYDLCVLTGDYRGQTYSPSKPRSRASRACGRTCAAPSGRCSATTTPFAWCPASKGSISACC